MEYHRALWLAQHGRDHRRKPVANNTWVEIIDEHTVGLRLHATYVVKWSDDGSVELNSGGWRTKTTAERINSHAPFITVGGRRVGKVPSGWWAFRGSWGQPIAPFFDGMRFDYEGTLINPQPDTANMIAAAEATAIEKYLDVYMKAAADQIYADALEQEPEGAQSCGDCSVVAHGLQELEGRTTEDGNKVAHLERHVGNCELVPELAWAAMRATPRPASTTTSDQTGPTS